jgi:putative phosphoribosyl transferase
VRDEESSGFTDRSDAGRRLAARLAPYENRHPVVLAMPRGGVPVAAEIAAALEAPLDLVFVRKIGVPFQPELAMGAIVDGETPIIVRNESVIRMAGVSEAQFTTVCEAELAELERRRRVYLGDRKPIDIAHRIVIVVDDGIATGASTRAVLRGLRAREPSEIVLAVPVAPTDRIESLASDADIIVCLESHMDFTAIGYFYRDFAQVSDAEVIETLARFRDESKGSV